MSAGGEGRAGTGEHRFSLTGGQVVAGSNPVSPTSEIAGGSDIPPLLRVPSRGMYSNGYSNPCGGRQKDDNEGSSWRRRKNGGDDTLARDRQRGRRGRRSACGATAMASADSNTSGLSSL